MRSALYETIDDEETAPKIETRTAKAASIFPDANVFENALQ